VSHTTSQATRRHTPHDVRIEKNRKAIVGGFQAQECVTYVDGHEIGRFSNAA